MPPAIRYTNTANISYVLSTDHPTCAPVIGGKTNFYHTDPSSTSTHGDPACANVQRAIHDGMAVQHRHRCRSDRDDGGGSGGRAAAAAALPGMQLTRLVSTSVHGRYRAPD
jgi:hypothetical protein